MNRKKYRPLYIFLFWWLFWLIIHNSSLSPIFIASLSTQFLFLLMIFSVSFGYIFAYLFNRNLNTNPTNTFQIAYYFSNYGRLIIVILLFLIFGILFYIGFGSGAFQMIPSSYFLHIRGSNGLENILTTSKVLNILIVLLIFPLLFSLWIIFICFPKNKFVKRTKAFIIFLHILFAYIYQVNYPIGMMLIPLSLELFIFGRDSYDNLSVSSKKKIRIYFLVFGSLLIYAASNRFGSFNLFGIFQRYFISYHTLGFYFFDVKLNDPSSLLVSNPSYGRSFLGWFDSVFDLIVRFFDQNLYKAAALENVNDNMVPIVSGRISGSILQGNAFGTILYTMFRDFGVGGILIYSFLYGFLLAYTFSNSSKIFMKCLFLILICSGLLSIYQSSVEKPFFWFSIIFVCFISLFIKNKTVIV